MHTAQLAQRLQTARQTVAAARRRAARHGLPTVNELADLEVVGAKLSERTAQLGAETTLDAEILRQAEAFCTVAESL